MFYLPCSTVDVKKTLPRSFAVPAFNDVYHCTVSPFPAERLSTICSLPFGQQVSVCHSYAIERWNGKRSWKRTVDVKKTFPRSFAVLPFNGVRTVKWQNVNSKTPVDRLSVSRRKPQRACATPTFSIGLRYNKEVAKRVLTHYKASTVRKRAAPKSPVATSAELRT